MRKFLAIRLLSMVFTIWAVATIMFFLVQFMPGDPTTRFLDYGFSEEAIHRQKELWGLNDPLHVQYVRYLKNLVTLEFGESMMQYTSVRDIILPKIWNTLSMMLPALALSIFIGALSGSYIGWKRGTRLEAGSLMFTLWMRSMPSFFAGLVALMVFTYWLKWTPSGGMGPPGQNLSFLETVFSLEFLKYLALPLLVIVLRGYDGPFLVMRTAMVEMRGEDFVEVLRAKGLSEWSVVMHAARNAILPLVTYVAVMTGFLFEGQVILETIFAWPGIGREIVAAIHDQDYPIAQAAFFLTAVMVVSMNLVADILYGYFDPRIKFT